MFPALPLFSHKSVHHMAQPLCLGGLSRCTSFANFSHLPKIGVPFLGESIDHEMMRGRGPIVQSLVRALNFPFWAAQTPGETARSEAGLIWPVS